MKDAAIGDAPASALGKHSVQLLSELPELLDLPLDGAKMACGQLIHVTTVLIRVCAKVQQ